MNICEFHRNQHTQKKYYQNRKQSGPDSIIDIVIMWDRDAPTGTQRFCTMYSL